MNRAIVLILMSLFTFSFAQDDVTVTEMDKPTQIAPGVSVVVTLKDNRQDLEVAQEVYLYPTMVNAKIEHDKDIGSFYIELSSKVLTEVVVTSDNPDLLVVNNIADDKVLLPAGARINVQMTAYEPHDGTIYVHNTEGELLGAVYYAVTKENRVRQTVSGSVSSNFVTDFQTSEFSQPFDVSFGYQIADRVTGVSGAIIMNYNGASLNMRGTISGSYSW